MWSRRAFLRLGRGSQGGRAGSGRAGIDEVAALSQSMAGHARSVAADEDYWREIQFARSPSTARSST
ncbi:MAG: hypothetical protein R2712_02025 [Vicinamibacterales bacterium]